MSIHGNNDIFVSSMNLVLFNKDFVIDDLIPNDEIACEENRLFVLYCKTANLKCINDAVTHYYHLQYGYINLLGKNKEKLLSLGSEEDNFSFFAKATIIDSLNKEDSSILIDTRINNIIFAPKPYPEIFYYSLNQNVIHLYRFINHYRNKTKESKIVKESDYYNILIKYQLKSFALFAESKPFSFYLKIMSNGKLDFIAKNTHNISLDFKIINFRREYPTNTYEHIIKPCGFYLNSEYKNNECEITCEGINKFEILILEYDFVLMKSLFDTYVPKDVYARKEDKKKKSRKKSISDILKNNKPENENNSPIDINADKSPKEQNSSPTINTPPIPTFNTIIPIINRFSNVIVTFSVNIPGITLQIYPSVYNPFCIFIKDILIVLTKSRSLSLFSTISMYYYNNNQNIYEPIIDDTSIPCHFNIEPLDNIYEMNINIMIEKSINISMTDSLIHSLLQGIEKNYKYIYYDIQPNSSVHIDNQLDYELYFSLSNFDTILTDFQKDCEIDLSTKVKDEISSIGIIENEDIKYIILYKIIDKMLYIHNYVTCIEEEYKIIDIECEDQIVKLKCEEKNIDIAVFDYEDINKIKKYIDSVIHKKDEEEIIPSNQLIKSFKVFSDIIYVNSYAHDNWKLLSNDLCQISSPSYPIQSINTNYYKNRKILFSANNTGKDSISVGIDDNKPQYYILKKDDNIYPIFSYVNNYPDGKVVVLSTPYIIVNHFSYPIKLNYNEYGRKSINKEIIIEPNHSKSLSLLYNKTNKITFIIDNVGTFKRTIEEYVLFFDGKSDSIDITEKLFNNNNKERASELNYNDFKELQKKRNEEEDYFEVKQYVSVELHRTLVNCNYLYHFIISPTICVENSFFYPIVVRISDPNTTNLISEIKLEPEQKLPIYSLKTFYKADYQISIACPVLKTDFSPYTDESRVYAKSLSKKGICVLYSDVRKTKFMLKLKWDKRLFESYPVLRIYTPLIMINNSSINIFSNVYKNEKKSVVLLPQRDISVYSRTEYCYPPIEDLIDIKEQIILSDYNPSQSNEILTFTLDGAVQYEDIKPKDIKKIDLKELRNTIVKYELKSTYDIVKMVFLTCRKGPGIFCKTYILTIQSLFSIYNNTPLPITINNSICDYIINPHHCYQYYKQSITNKIKIDYGGKTYVSNNISVLDDPIIIRLYDNKTGSKMFAKLNHYLKIGTNIIDVSICSSYDSDTEIQNLLPNYYIYVVERDECLKSCDPGVLLCPYQIKNYTYFSCFAKYFDIYLYPITIEIDKDMIDCSKAIYHYQYDLNKRTFQYLSVNIPENNTITPKTTTIQDNSYVVSFQPSEYTNKKMIINNVIDKYIRDIKILKNNYNLREINENEMRKGKYIMLDLLQIKGYKYSEILNCIITNKNKSYKFVSHDSGLFFFKLFLIEDPGDEFSVSFYNLNDELILTCKIKKEYNNDMSFTPIVIVKKEVIHNDDLIQPLLFYRIVNCESKEDGYKKIKQLQAFYLYDVLVKTIKNGKKILRNSLIRNNTKMNIQRYNFEIYSPMVTICLIDDKPQEVLTFTAEKFIFSITQTNVILIEVKVNSIEINDNRKYTKLLPVLCYKDPKYNDKCFKLTAKYLSNKKIQMMSIEVSVYFFIF